ncbi:hypothetical protein CDD83_2755 [Cordyceps sp. RAO-2017]|nr:hypothetical protein CDD83_2755 [Cordyceps sp. RAO-2017]
MHYVRLLRPPKLSRSARATQVELVLAVTTDLGDAYLLPDEALDLVVRAEVKSSSTSAVVASCELSAHEKLQWRAGNRVLKPTFELPPAVARAVASGDRVELCVGPAPPFSADGLRTILASSEDGAEGLVMPVWVVLGGGGANGDDDVCLRRLRLGSAAVAAQLELEEELGDSIARHIWDASPVALAALAGAYESPGRESSRPQPCVQQLRRLFDESESINILELGCGVGILGAGLSAVYPRARARACTILMTDLDQAAGRARSNLGLLTRQQAAGSARLLYENLDWEDGRDGRFGPLLRHRRWDLVMLSDCTYNTDTLPALVATLSALHRYNARQVDGGDAFTSKVFIATKPRHPSERAVFDLLAKDGWSTLATQTLPLPVMGGEAQVVEMYLFEKE